MLDIMNSYEDTIAKIPGQLNVTTAYLTMFLLNEQNLANINGNILEIGVYGGRYIAIMQYFLKENEKAIGLDPFYVKGSDKKQVIDALKAVNCIDNVEIIETRSDGFSKEQYLENWGKIRFLHIDGSHQYEDVLKDLEIANFILQNNGLIAFDDFFNPYWMGVSEALFIYKERNPYVDIVPVGFSLNKLFFSRKNNKDYYQNLFNQFINQHPDRLKGIRGAHNRTSKIFGQDIHVLY